MKQKEKQELQKEIDRLQAKLNELGSDDNYEVGKWYIASCLGTDRYLILLDSVGNNGFYSKCWFSKKSHFKCVGTFPSIEREATEEEVKEALIKEAKIRGFKGGVKCNSVVYGTDGITHHRDSTYWDYGYNAFMYLGMYIFKDGVWAEIIKEETKEYTLKGGTKVLITKDNIGADYEEYPIYLLEELSRSMRKAKNWFPYKTPHTLEFVVKLGCEIISAKDIEEILNLQKQLK